MADDDGELTIEQRIEKAVNDRLAADQAKTDRANRLKKLGLTSEVIDEIAEGVFARFTKAAEDRAAAAEEADQAPSRSSRQSGVRGLFGLIPQEDAG